MSGLRLPVALGSASAWALADYRSVVLASEPAAAGSATAQGEQLDPGVLWLIDHMVSTCSSSTPTTLRLYEGYPSPAALLDGTNSGNFDVADWPNGLQLQPSRALVAVWSNASDDAQGILTLQVRELRQVSV